MSRPRANIDEDLARVVERIRFWETQPPGMRQRQALLYYARRYAFLQARLKHGKSPTRAEPGIGRIVAKIIDASIRSDPRPPKSGSKLRAGTGRLGVEWQHGEPERATTRIKPAGKPAGGVRD